ncbi:DUF6167 family protein [Solicola gregarius]|uniref:DUF6167 family protein n=1 Tax=Solicola gregarius TaxID=2908642 RepID=A0AA46THX0_9ACTN|nr:DUF6167 family protein [Solicola gregarius]UYM04823.1 DUF6167 family protein [Solicola gregarius]
MKGRTLWFLVGAGAGVYTSIKARRLAYRLTPAGLADQAAALGAGVQAFGDEVRAGMAERETQIAEELGLPAPRTQQMIEQRGTTR